MLILDKSHKDVLKEELEDVHSLHQEVKSNISSLSFKDSNIKETQEKETQEPYIMKQSSASIDDSFTVEDLNEEIVNDVANDELVNNKFAKDNVNLKKSEKKMTAFEIAEKRRAEQLEKKINSAVNSFYEQVNSFEFKNSRETTALNILDKIPATEENLELLNRIKIKAPDDVKYLVQKKIKSVRLNSRKKRKNIKFHNSTIRSIKVPALNMVK